MNELKVFSSSEFGELGVMLIDGKEYFPAVQCAKILGYQNPRDAVKRHCKEDGVVKHDGVSYTTNQYGVTTQQITEIKYINEGNLYRLIVSSKLPAAEKFERWVFDEVLPGIRKNGGYGSQAGLSSADIEKLITATAAEVVSKVVPAVVTAVLNNIPAITDNAVTAEGSHANFEKPKKRRARSCRQRCIQPCKMELLPPEVKEQADEMIASGNYSCQQVANFVTNSTGEYISQMAVNNYRRKFFDIAEE